MRIPTVSYRRRFRGQSVVEALLIGPIIFVILIIATKVGQYFYSLSMSESISYTNSIVYSTTGEPWYLPSRQVESPLRYWDALTMTYARPADVFRAPVVFSGHCLAGYTIYISDLGFIANDPESDYPNSIWGFDLFVYSSSVAFRPLYGGLSPTGGAPLSCDKSDTFYWGVE